MDVGFEGEVSYTYFVGEILNPGSEGRHVGLEGLYIGVSRAVIEVGYDRG